MNQLRYAKSGDAYTVEATLDVKNCPVCGVLYAVDSALMAIHDERGTNWHCPNGHSLIFTKPKVQQEKERADAAERRAKSAENAAAWQRQQRQAALRSLAATKGHLTRMKNRIANGVCPVAGCKRSGFSNVMSHIAQKHPEWHADHARDFRPVETTEEP